MKSHNPQPYRDPVNIALVSTILILCVCAVLLWTGASGAGVGFGKYRPPTRTFHSSNVPLPVETVPVMSPTPWCVGAVDYSVFRMAFGQQDGVGQDYIAEFDFDRDSTVDIADFTQFRSDFGRCVP